MDTANKSNGYETGADFFRDTAASYGGDEALNICGNYLATQLQKEQSKDEHQFCRELFAAMQETAAGRCDPAKLVYPFDIQTADDRLEASIYHSSRKLNVECAHAIDVAINTSCYAPNYYNLDIAAMKAVHDFGFSRVNLVLASNFQQRDYDGRFSDSNKKWAKELPVGKAFDRAVLNAHPVLLDSFANHARKLFDEIGAQRFALPGRPESGEKVQGYEIERSIAFDNQRGFAIGHNPDAASPFVCWQFTADENGKRDFYWGAYASDRDAAAQSYVARIISHMDDGAMREVRPAAEKRERPSVLGKLKKTHEQQPPSVKAKAPKAKEPER